MEYGLGIDFGTTYCAAAVSTSRGVEVCTLGTRAASIPTVVLVRSTGDVLVGEPAERRAIEEPDRAAFAFKRRLGDPTPLVLGGTPYGAETLTAYVLTSIVRQVTQQNGEPPSNIVLSHPAPYGEYKIDLIRMAARQADIGPVSFISEPEAAAIHYSTLERIDVGQVVAVYDFGGGTFDAALLRKTPDGFTLIGHPEGLERIGGIDLDHAVLQHVLGSLGLRNNELPTADPDTAAALARLRDECRSAKEALSSDADVTIPVTFPNLVTHVRLTRVEFEAMIRPRVADTIEALRRAVRSAGLDMSDVGRILLVGGTSRIPLVREMVREATGRPVTVDVHPKHSVALGAATLARPSTAPRSPAAPPRPSASTAPPPPAMSPPTPPVVSPEVSPSMPPVVSPVVAAHPAPTAARPMSPPPPPAPQPTLDPPPIHDSPTAELATPTESERSRRRLPAVIAAVVAIAAVAIVAFLVLVLDDNDQNASGDTPSTAAVDDTSAGVGQELTGAEPFAETLPRSTTYSNLLISLDRFVVRTQDPGSFQSGQPEDPDGPPFAYLDATFFNALGVVPIAISSTTFTLVLSDGSELEATQVDNPSLVGPSESAPILLAYGLGGDVDFTGASVRVADAGDSPAVVPLDGDPIDPPADLAVSVSTSLDMADLDGNVITWWIGDGTASLDSGVDTLDLSGGQATADRRAGEGNRWLNLPLSLAVGDCSCDGISVDSSMVRLDIEGTTYDSANSFGEYLGSGASFDVTLGFEIPADASTVTLVIGPVDQPELQQTTTIEIPSS